MEERKCPRCGAIYRAHSAISRVDNQTLICPDCGTREALESLSVGVEEQNKILETLHKYAGGQKDDEENITR